MMEEGGCLSMIDICRVWMLFVIFDAISEGVFGVIRFFVVVNTLHMPYMIRCFLYIEK